MMLLKNEMAAVAELDADLKQHQSDVLASVLACGAAEGCPPEGFDSEVEALLLMGPILMAALTGSTPLTHEFADRCVDHFLVGVRAGAPTSA